MRRPMVALSFVVSCASCAEPVSDPPACGDGFQAEGSGCVDVDECAADNGGCGATADFTCENVVGGPPICHYDPRSDWQILTNGVGSVDLGGSQPDSFVVWGETAFPVVLDELHRAFVVAARAGQGRVVAFGHEGQLTQGPSDPGDGDRLVENALRWAGQGESPRVGVAPEFQGLADRLAAAGWDASVRAVAELDDIDVFVDSSWNDRSAEDLDALAAWTEGGGGLLAGGHAWYWAYSNDDVWTNYSGNRMVRGAGFAWTAWGDVSAGQDTVGPEVPEPIWYAGGAISLLEQHIDGTIALDLEDQVVGADAVGRAVDLLPLDLPSFWDRVLSLAERIGPRVPTAMAPIDRAEEPLAQLVVRVDLKFAENLPPEQLWEYRIDADFPGGGSACVAGPEATVRVDGHYAGLPSELWYAGAGADLRRSTGLYAPPGAALEVDVPASVAGQGLAILIGAHSDDIGGADSWTRYPRVTRRYALEAERTTVGNAFGGLIYVLVPAGTDVGAFDLVVRGATPAPLFVLGEMDDDLWAQERLDPAPWAEIAGPSYVITVPSEAIRDLDSAEAVANVWEEVLHGAAVLSATPEPRARAERLVFDRQISAGWMHSGYPMMAHLDSVTEVLDVENLYVASAWGPLHELGHNHQWGPWILPGTTEASCNLFSIYLSEEVFSVPRDVAHEAMRADARADRVTSYLDGGADFWADWSVWTALETYVQVQEAFGWQPLSAAFATYRGMDAAGVPQDDAARIDTWVRVLSEAVGRDLSGFHLAWGFPLSEEVIADLAHLPPWTEHPMVGAR